jgi:hypothetical protein
MADQADMFASVPGVGAARTVGDYVALLAHYQRRAVDAWATSGERMALEEVRRIGALSLLCMQAHGAPGLRGELVERAPRAGGET